MKNMQKGYSITLVQVYSITVCQPFRTTKNLVSTLYQTRLNFHIKLIFLKQKYTHLYFYIVDLLVPHI
mgnify:CR=1 FL=1